MRCPRCQLKILDIPYSGKCPRCELVLSDEETQTYNEEECPECGNPTMPIEGCRQCPACGWSKCGQGVFMDLRLRFTYLNPNMTEEQTYNQLQNLPSQHLLKETMENSIFIVHIENFPGVLLGSLS